MAELMDSLTRALQLAHLFQSLKQGPEDRAWQLQQRQQEQQDRQRGQQLQDAQLTEHYNAMGAHQGNPMVESALNSVFGPPADPRTPVTLPNKQTYYLPTDKEQKQSQIEDYYNKERAKTLADTEPLTLPAEMGGGTTRVKVGEKAQRLTAIYSAMHPNMNIETHVMPDGATTIVRDPKSGNEVSRKFDSSIKSASPVHYSSTVDDRGTKTTEVFKNGEKTDTVTTPGVGKTKNADEDRQMRQDFVKYKAVRFNFEASRAEAVEAIKEAEQNGDDTLLEKAKEKVRHASALMDVIQTTYPQFVTKSGLGNDRYSLPYIEGVDVLPQNSATATPAASSPTIIDSQGKAKLALGNYRKMPAEQRDKVDPKAGISPRQWFLKRFGYDPDSVK